MDGFMRCGFALLHVVVVYSMLVVHLDASYTPSILTTLDDPCRGEPKNVCLTDGNGNGQKGVIRDAFSADSTDIDVIFIVCVTNDCTSSLLSVTDFIEQLLNFLAISYGVKVDPGHLHTAIVAYNYSDTWTFSDGISSGQQRVDSCQFHNIIDDLRGPLANRSSPSQECKLAEALELAKTLFENSVRTNAMRIVWVFSDCRYCARGRGEPTPSPLAAKALQINNVADALKAIEVTVFTAGISRCPNGFFDSLDKEDLLKSVATSDNHYACLDSWTGFPFIKSSAGSTEVYADLGDGVHCDLCPNGSKSNYQCVCNVVGKSYSCEDIAPNTSFPKVFQIVVGVVAGIIIIIVVVVVIIVACFCRGRRRCRCRCRKNTNGSPPTVPIRNPPVSPPVSPPASPPVPPPAPPRRPQPTETGYGYANNAVDEIEIDYEFLECERQMEGWCHHLTTKKEQYNILHLGIYSMSGEYFAQTPGFALSSQERTKIHEIMENHHHHHRITSLTVASAEFLVDDATLSERFLSGRSSDRALLAMSSGGYMAIGVARLNQSIGCQSAVKAILDDITRATDG